MHNAATPIYEAPDEIWHDAYIRWLVRTGEFPPQDSDRSGAYQEVTQPPLYYLIASLIRAPFPDENLPNIRWHNPGFGTQAPGTLPDNKNMLIHTELEAWPWRDAALAIHITRLTSLGFGLLTLIGLWHLALAAFGDRRAAVTATALVAFHPQFVFMSSVISNDTAATAFATLGLWLSARTVRRGSPWQQTFAMGATAGLAALTKTSTLPLIGIMAASLVWRVLCQGETSSPRETRRVMTNLALLGVTFAITAGWWYLRNARLYGDPLGLGSHRDTPWARTELATLPELVTEIPLLIRSFWNGYGWGHVTWPASVAWILTALSALLWLRGLIHWIQKIRRHLSPPKEASIAGLSRSVMMGLTLVWAAVIFIALLRWMQMVEAPHGRLLFPAIGAWSLWMTLGIEPNRVHLGLNRIARILLLGLLASLSALAPGARLLATYAPPRLRPPEALPNTCEANTLSYGGQAALLCADVTPTRLSVGEIVEVQGCWQAVTPMVNNYTVFIHLIDDQMTRVAERHTYPGLGRFPTSLWPQDRAFCDTYRLTVEPWADAPRLYKLEIGLFNTETGDRLRATSGAGAPLDPPIVGTVSVIPQAWDRPMPDVTRDVNVGTFAHLVGFDAPPRVQPGETVTVTLYWQATATYPPDAAAFVHLWSPGENEPWAQHDALPREGAYPTRVWVEGDSITDRHPLSVPDDLPAGRYPLWAGLYLRADGTRLPAVGPEGRYPNDLIPLGTVEIE
jgi:4-amino-4-deoxy-L-arabinose transferase-like glycosyltransferase